MVPCSDAHEAQVVAQVDLGGGRYPGEREVVAQSEEACAKALPGSVLTQAQASPQPVALTYLYPRGVDWTRGDHEALCLITADGPVLRGSLLAGTSS